MWETSSWNKLVSGCLGGTHRAPALGVVSGNRYRAAAKFPDFLELLPARLSFLRDVPPGGLNLWPAESQFSSYPVLSLDMSPPYKPTPYQPEAQASDKRLNTNPLHTSPKRKRVTSPLHTSPKRKRVTHTAIQMSQSDPKPNHSLARRTCIRITRLRVGLVLESLACASGLY